MERVKSVDRTHREKDQRLTKALLCQRLLVSCCRKGQVDFEVIFEKNHQFVSSLRFPFDSTPRQTSHVCTVS